MKESPIKVYDARWEVEDFTHFEIEKLFLAACAYGRELNADTVAIARDARLGCPDVVEIAVDTARKAGFTVYLCQEPISTPQSYYNILRITEGHPEAMGWTITASHNPPSYIGVKFVVSPVRAIGRDSGPSGGLSRIQELYDVNDNDIVVSGRSQGALRMINFTYDFIKDTLKWAGVEEGGLKRTSVVLDALNGSAGTEIYRALDLAGVEIIPLRLVVNGSFPSGAPNPISEGKLAEAVRLAGEREGSTVIGLDGDGDRIAFGNKDGLFSAGAAMIPVLTMLKEMDPDSVGPVLCDPKVDPLSLDAWSRTGFKPVLFRNGHSQIKEYMMKHKISAAAEESGHFYHRLQRKGLHVYCENSLLTILLFLKALQQYPEMFDSIKRITETVNTTGEMNYQFLSDLDRDDALSRSVSFLRDDGAAITETTREGIDLQGVAFVKGVDTQTNRVIVDDWYCGFYRISTNEKSVARFYISSGSEKVLSELYKRIQIICKDELSGEKID